MSSDLAFEGGLRSSKAKLVGDEITLVVVLLHGVSELSWLLG